MKCPRCSTQNPQYATFCKSCATLLPPYDQTMSLPPEAHDLSDIQLTYGGIFAERYKILEKLGGGGMGVVYKAEDLRLKRNVALKLLPPSLTKNPEYKQRFIQEAQAASILEHQNICTIHEIDETPDGQLYIAMAYYPGETLKQKIGRGSIPFEHTFDMVRQIGQGLARAHSQGIIHRDIKPSNVMVTGEGVVKIVDFGLAKLAGPHQITLASSRVGTIFYMSPEQALGEDTDHRTDLWSLGVVFYELLTGKLPFEGEHEQAVLYAIVHKSPIPPTEWKKGIPDEAERIIYKCLQKSAAGRYQSAEQLLSDLNQLKRLLEIEKYKDIIDKEKPKGKPEAERRPATVMFVELSGYSQILETLDPEEATVLSSRLFKLLNSIFEKYGARIEKISGGSLLALFGVPTAIEDAPKKAINAAIEIRERISQFNQEECLRAPLDVCIGVNTGTVIAGVIDVGGKKELSILGEAVSLAADLKDLAAKGHVCVGPTTYKHTKEDFEYEKMKPVAREGGTSHVPAYKLVSIQKNIYRAKRGAERMIHSKMVGRDREFDRLRLHVLKVINGEGSIVNVIGEAGIGKSRLIAELGTTDEIKKVTFLQGRALSIGKNLSFHPIIDILKNWAQIKEEDSSIASAQRIENKIKEASPDEAPEVFPFIATMMGLKISGSAAERVRGIEGEALEKLILKSLRELLAKVSEIRPLVIVIDDLHWADGTTIEFLLSLFRLAQSHRILFINIFRPEYDKTGERVARHVRELHAAYSAEIRLDPLQRDHCLTLVENLLNITGLPASLQELIIQKTEGNPFFIEEVVQSFIDVGAVEVKEDGFRVTEKIDSVVIPETVQEILMSRIDRLDEETCSLLKVASVIGRNFFYKILAEVAKSTSEIDGRLLFLKEVQLIKERRRLEELEYLFKHALVQEVVYDSVLLKKRKELHLRVAESIECVFSHKLHEFYGVLAYHYSRGENFEKAEEYLVKSGEEALKAAASSEAIYYYQEALKLYLHKQEEASDPDAVAHLEWNIAKAFLNKGRMAEAVQHFDRVMEIWGERRPKMRITKLLSLASNLARVIPQKKVKKAPSPIMNNIFEIIYHRGTALVSVDTWRMITDSLRFVGTARNFDITKISNGVAMYASSSALFFFSGISFGIARKLLDYAAQFIDPDDTKTLYKYKFWEAAMDTLSGNWMKERQFDPNILDRNIREGDPYTPPGYVFYLGILATEQGNFHDSEVFINKLQEIGDVYENDYTRVRKYVLKANDLLKRRKLEEALREVDEGLSWLRPIEQKFWSLCLLGIKTKSCLLLGDRGRAQDALKQWERNISGEKYIAPFYQSTYWVGRFFYDLCDLEEAVRSSSSARIVQQRKKTYRSGTLSLKNAKKCAFGRTEIFNLMGVYYWLVKKPRKAWAWWGKSVKVGQELGARPELARTFAEIGKRLSRRAGPVSAFKRVSAAEYIQKAHDLFDELGLAWDIEDLTTSGRGHF
jgi:serine/threonine protein kinase/tetratricopeptide (TPR) repeat protein